MAISYLSQVCFYYMRTTIELFAGAGGLALGVEKAGFDALGLIEFDKDASDALKKIDLIGM